VDYENPELPTKGTGAECPSPTTGVLLAGRCS
jgi:hypothetical protein